MPKMALENIIDDLRNGYFRLVKGSFIRIDQLQEELIHNKELRKHPFYTSDGQGYFLREDGGVDWVITPEDENLVLRHIYDEVNSSYDQLILEGNFRPDNAEAEVVRKAEGIVVVDMDKLHLSHKRGKDLAALHIRTEDGFIETESGVYQPPNEEEQKVMERLRYTKKTLDVLKRQMSWTRIYFLDPEYVARELEGSDDNSLWRASSVNSFNEGFFFGAGNNTVNEHYENMRLRGVRRTIVPNNFVPQEMNLEGCYKKILSDPAAAVEAMNEETAAGLSAILTGYLATKK